VLIGRPPNLGTFQAAGHAATTAIDPLDDANIKAEYRRSVVGAMVRRALETAAT
jgi:aerobic carbon-monoxide dehydrogenase medium subunit